ncbi:LysR family transcriptional regulator [Aquincola sp. S2]|uniref:LysR family transcriptional regulator n=1 Tax=Pseudaquabacterium terrae TaxID=2732868 RepID=A0ABX2ENQ4_9BURK|nr:LysR substrate-binding domain-containing protein [Aquabacterium terrae]NRF70253.1 LysR family transcriptional regulator [Aquabacterium terrae]
MKLQQLEVFVHVARERSLRAAARRLALTQPAITRTIQELEADLGAVLLNRSAKGVELTSFGQVLEVRASQLLEDARRAREEIAQLQGELRGTLTFGTTSSIALTLLPQAVLQFRQSAPKAELSIIELKYPHGLRRLRDGQADFAAMHLLPDMLDDDLRSIPLLETDFVAVARAGNPLIGARTLAELAGAQWLQPLAGSAQPGSIVATAFRNAGLTPPEGAVRYASFAVMLGLVSSTDMLGAASRPLAERLAAFGLLPVKLRKPLARVQMGVVMRKSYRPTPVATQFLACLQTAARAVAARRP